jgi:hypothetical protein
MTRLCQIVALESGVRNKAYAELTEHFKAIQRAQQVSGLTRTYDPKDAEGETFPAESTRVQVTVDAALKVSVTALTRLFDVTATKDWANTVARADVTLPGLDEPLLVGVPVTYLLFLAKQLKDLRALIVKMPVHDPADRWVPADQPGVYRTEPPVVSHRTRKVPRNHVKAPATDKHPAQVDVYFEDITVGYWTAVKFTGGIPEARQAGLLARVDTLAEAVSNAREEANARQVEDVHAGAAVLSWIFD